jgi:branched-chain amino acid transport system permease protein
MRWSAIIKSAVLLAILIALLLMPRWGSDRMLNIFVLIFLYMGMGQMWNLLAGYAGLVSLGQQMFIGLGGYTVAVICQSYNLPVVLGVAVAPFVCMIFALVISLPIFKMSGMFFTIGSWIVAEALLLFFTNWGFVKYGFGFTIVAGRSLPLGLRYITALILGIGSILVVYLTLRTRFGLGIMAMRDNEAVSEVRGVKIYRTKLVCFLISAFITGLVGGVMHLFDGYIQPYAAFNIDWIVTMVFMVIIGGIGTIEGPIIGAFIYVLLRQYLLNFPGGSMLVFGAIALVIILLAPKGIMGLLQDKTGFEVFSVRRTMRAARPADKASSA